ncbi:Transcriptional regulator, TetR family [Actinokineospora spheciospongiae]|uniref:Transcriptional regulator, TetR family n=1 Tax=Actinokineospora spheciospongiae TaxID=909613 RepID=W7IVD9_9PSEU|nr:TetR/AcrR family transcriptional regulator C-terminal domain-containing protein [Actinokineospora spheciospongiae]EWC64338.1 Transcriptional regulator, TetR family [Actinokineospora spheciospongiae]PWW63273.1 TetR family transcriptional regulator [Actinokineospora spheciospongiae]
MPTEDAVPRRAGRPARLSKEAIVAAAAAIVEADGVEQLSMRRLAKDLSSTPMALYHHVEDKDELLLLLLEAHARGFPRPELPTEPRQRLLAAARTLHDVLADCPWIVEVLASDDLVAPSALWIVEDILDAAVRCGLTPEEAVHAYRVIWYYTAGELLVHFTRSRRRAEAGTPTHRDRAFAALDPTAYPRLTSMSGRWVALTTEDSHRRGLAAIITGLLSTDTTR